MTTAAHPSREIDGKGRTVRELLAGRKYSIDYYQREYKWQQKQLAELIDDLAAKFLESHEEGNERSAVAEYGHYFLGSIIASDKDGQKFIIDGQQRLTTLTLLLIFLHHHLDDAEQKGQIADLIFSQKYGKRSFNLDIPERAACMEALDKGEEFAEPDPAGSIVNVLARYSELEDLFPDELAGPALPYFVDWLVENVHLVEITAYSDEDAFHRLLARMTDYVETRSGQASRYAEYAQRGKKGYEIEHVRADHPERHRDEFGHPSEFQEYRNRIGGLLLLPKSFNASHGDLPYAEKRAHYAGQNLLAKSLHESAYDHNPGFKRFIEQSGLPFRAHAEFRKADLGARQALYQQLAERIWSPERLAQEAVS